MIIIDTILKSIQILFFAVGSTVAILTYIKAKNGLLNTINTEYHKKIIERLSAVSHELYQEFDEESDLFWGRSNFTKAIIDGINEQIAPNKVIISGLEVGMFGVPHPIELTRMSSYASRIRSDPFIPSKIREKILIYLDGRIKSLQGAVLTEARNYGNALMQGSYLETLDENYAWVHNNIMATIRKDGFGILENEQAVNNIRIDIQKYFESFNPIR